MAIHGAEGTWFHCDECDYKTLRNKHLKTHKIAKLVQKELGFIVKEFARSRKNIVVLR